MLRLTRLTAASLTAIAILFTQAAPAAAQTSALANADREASVPLLIDALVLRPMGLVLTVAGAAVFAVPVAPVMAVTRPTDLGKPFRKLVVEPARYTFIDPLGLHPNHGE